ncbi:unnamed protein product [Toxocara canis]|uniref:Myotubularin phosphatase domain-containing protein n=1 Tax=Toxocara canis TaxID=6265 RepID=A0A183VFJ3_TOXCA|nr:unnamed protein product [Toxocara canis]
MQVAGVDSLDCTTYTPTYLPHTETKALKHFQWAIDHLRLSEFKSDEYLIYSPQRLHRFTFVCGREHDPVATREWSSLRAQIAVECEWDRTVLTSILNAMRFGNIDASCNKTNTRQSNGLIAEWAIVAPKG